MNKASIILTIAALTIPFAAHAEGDESKKRAKGKKFRAMMIEKFDTDGDGKLSDSEKEAAKTAMKARRAEFIAQHDTDGDGKLSEEEKQAAKENFIAQYDTDGDGKLSEAERELARDAGAKFPMHKKKKCKKKGSNEDSAE